MMVLMTPDGDGDGGNCIDNDSDDDEDDNDQDHEHDGYQSDDSALDVYVAGDGQWRVAMHMRRRKEQRR